MYKKLFYEDYLCDEAVAKNIEEGKRRFRWFKTEWVLTNSISSRLAENLFLEGWWTCIEAHREGQFILLSKILYSSQFIKTSWKQKSRYLKRDWYWKPSCGTILITIARTVMLQIDLKAVPISE